MWTLANVKTDLNNFLGPTMNPISWMYISKVFKKDDNKEFRTVQNLTKGEADFNQFMQLRSQIVIAAQNFPRGENLSPVQIATLYKDMVEQLKLAHKVVDVVDRANRKIVWLYCCTMWTSLRVLMLKSDYLQGRRRTKSINKLLMWIINLKNLSIYLIEWILFMTIKILINPFVMSYKELIHILTFYQFRFFSSQDKLEQWR